MTNAELQTMLLRVLASNSPNLDRRLGRGQHYLMEHIQQMSEPQSKLSSAAFMEAAWSLVGQGLAYIDFRQSAVENWELRLTEAGRAAAKDEEYNPNSAGSFLARVESAVPDASEVVMQYAREAVNAYTARCYLASTVMLGVASEAAFLEMARAFVAWLPTGEGTKLSEMIERKGSNFVGKFDEFRKRVEPRKSSLPDELADGMALTLDAVADLLRINRNEAGHPTGKKIDRDDAFISLQMFARYLQRLYALKAFFAIPQTASSI